MMKRIRINGNIAAVVAAMVLAACSDELLPYGGEYDTQGMSLAVSVVEQADLVYDYGQTRGTSGASLADVCNANVAAAHPLKGGENENLYVHRMPLPYVGIHSKAVQGAQHAQSTTRAALSEIAYGGIDFHDSLSVWAYTSAGTTLLKDIIVQKVNGFRTALEWPYAESGNTMKFYAISPAVESIEEYLTITNEASVSYSTAPTFTYTVPDNPDAQRDLLYGTSSAIAISTYTERTTGAVDDRTVAMTFEHILTAVRFAQGNMPVGTVVKSVTISGVKNKGTYTPGTGWGSSQSGSASYELTVNWPVTEYSPTNVYIDGGNVLFLMPQTVPDDATLSVVLNDGASDHTLTATLTGDMWSPGYTVTYKITIGKVASNYYLVIDTGDSGSEVLTPTADATTSSNKYSQNTSGSVESSDGASGGTFTVHSFRNYLDYSSASTPTNKWYDVSWQVAGYATAKDGDYAYDNTPAGYISDLTISSNSIKAGGTTYTTGGSQEVAYTMANQTAAYSGNHATTLKNNNAIVGTMNLSTHLPDGSTTTGVAMSGYSSGSVYNSANSYIVNAPGTYSFPLVYGNSYQAGVVNLNNGSGIFVDHAGRAITNAYILDQVNYTVSTDVEESATAADATAAEVAIETLGKTKVTTDISYNNSASDIEAAIVWQDVSGLFLTPVISGSTIQFTVSGTPAPGNCVIAFTGKKTTKTTRKIYNSSSELLKTVTSTETEAGATILWTWHIWCTDEVYPNSGTADPYYPQYDSSTSSKITTFYNSSGVATSTKILPVNLGWVPDADAWSYYAPRDVWIKLTQTGSDNVAYVKLSKHAAQPLVTGTSTVYQWGRPTALPMVKTVGGASRSVYNSSGTDISSSFMIKQVSSDYVPTAITNPLMLMRSTDAGTWWDSSQNNLYWSTTGKTLYDPCPPGFMLPAMADVVTAVNVASPAYDTEYSGAANLNIWEGATDAGEGGYFYAKQHTSAVGSEDRYGCIYYIPTSSYWSANGDDGTLLSTRQTDTSVGYFWLSDHSSASRGSSFYFLPQSTLAGSVVKFITVDNSGARPVRAKAE